MNKFPLIALATATALMAACASAPTTTPEVDAARARIDTVAADPIAREVAASSINAAEQDLKRAQQALKERESAATVHHYAYLADHHAQIAAEQVSERHARMVVEKGQADRDRVLLEARTREVDSARALADMARAAALSASADAERLRNELQAKQTERGMVVTLGDVLFDTARSELKPGAMATVDRLASFLREHEGYQLLLEGHTDSRGDDNYNLTLSERRADSVRNALLARGLTSDRVRVRAMGEAVPVADNESAAGRQQNRRVEIVFSDAQGHFSGEPPRQVRSGP